MPRNNSNPLLRARLLSFELSQYFYCKANPLLKKKEEILI